MQHHYRRFLIMIVLHFIAMYIFMYAMVNVFGNVFNSFNQVYMAALMTASMVLIELPLMSSMYESKKLNIIIIVAGAVVLIGSWFAIRQQAAIGDRQISSIDDPASRRSDPDVRAGFDSGPGNSNAVSEHHLKSTS